MIYKTSKKFDEEVVNSEIGTEFKLHDKVFIRKGSSWKYLVLKENLEKDPEYLPEHPSGLYGEPIAYPIYSYINNRGYIIDGEFTGGPISEKEIKSHMKRKYCRSKKLACEKTRGRRFKKCRGYKRKYHFSWLSVYPLACEEWLDPDKSDEEIDMIEKSRLEAAREILNNLISGRYKIKIKIVKGAKKASFLPVSYVRDLLPKNFPDDIEYVYINKVYLYDTLKSRFIKYVCRNNKYIVEENINQFINVVYYTYELL